MLIPPFKNIRTVQLNSVPTNSSQIIYDDLFLARFPVENWKERSYLKNLAEKSKMQIT